MSASVNARNPTYNDHRTSATLGAKPRVSSSRAEAKLRPGVPDDILPHDSINNAGKLRPSSGSYRGSTSVAHSYNERLTERHKVTTNESVQFTSRSPLKSYGSSEENAGTERASRGPMPIPAASNRRERPAQRKLPFGRIKRRPTLSAADTLESSNMGAKGTSSTSYFCTLGFTNLDPSVFLANP